ncbi:MAG: hypothetical protein LPK45_09785 [Bacteroidota bacterium]|nr:hypothetical protein [Bacteroidota bacterium]MDX5431380.1 hypothetical protein [Bacteroidota bacterium]MDX5470110.1 hypothetical protein [Bacteroidota bacterium]
MAINKRHIDEELRRQLANHQAPVQETEWDAFEQFMDARQPKKRPVAWWKYAAILLLLVSVGVVVWNPFSSSELTDKKESAQSTTIENVPQPELGSANPQSKNTVRPETLSGESTSPSGHETNQGIESTSGQPSAKSSQTTDNSAINPEASESRTPRPEGLREVYTPQEEEIETSRFAERTVKTISPRVLLIPTPKWGWFEQSFLAVNTPAEKPKANNNQNNPGRGKSIRVPSFGPAITAGVSYGFGNPALQTKTGDPSYVHEDYNNRLKESTARTNALRFFASYEYQMKAGIRVSAGIQYTQTTQTRQFNFEQRKIPYIGLDGEIITYLQIPAGQPVTPTVFVSEESIQTASIPLTLSYSRSLTPNLSFGVRAQSGIGLNWANQFNGLSPLTLTEESMSSPVNPMNLTYGGGLFGEYVYLSKWGIRANFDWVGQNKQYQSSNSYNLNNRFYECKLTLVRYL